MSQYAVVGSSTTPTHYNKLITKVATLLEADGYTLRTRGREGFEQSALDGVEFKQNKIILDEKKLNVQQIFTYTTLLSRP